MPLDPAVLSDFALSFDASAWIRSLKLTHRSTPLGMGYGDTRFASPTRGFQLIYIAEDLPTSLAEAILRDRFDTGARREIMRSEVDEWGACQVSTTASLTLLDLRGDACFTLGISSDIAGGKAQDEARAFSQSLYDETDLDGILYHSRLRKAHDCVAVYDRAVSKLAANDVGALDTLAGLVPALKDLRVDLLA